MRSFRRAALLTLWLLAGLVGACMLWLRLERHQYALDRQLIAALAKGDDKQALALVNAGADPNTPWDPTPMPSLSQLAKQVLHRIPPSVKTSYIAFDEVCDFAMSPYFPKREPGATTASNPLIRAMLQRGANVNVKNPEGRTPLMLAANDEYADMVPLLLERGADVNARDSRGVTPLIYAAHSPTLARLLLQQGADVNARSHEGTTPLIEMFHWGGSHAYAPPTPEFVHLMLEYGANVNVRAPDTGDTPLIYAVNIQDKAIIGQLLAHGADPNVCNNDKSTPMMWAKSYKLLGIVALLKRAGAK